MTHLTPDELVDAVDGTLAPDRQSHVDACITCRDEAVRLSAILRESRALEIPEPSPMFWDHFSARVQAAIAEEDAPRTGWAPQWLGWRVLAPVGALAMLIMALAVSVPRAPVADPVVAAVDPATSLSDEVAVHDEPEWTLVSDIVGPVDIDRAHEAGIVVQPGDVERAVLELSAAEQRELLRLLKEEIAKAGD